MDWSDATIGQGEADFPAILARWWSRLLQKSYSPILMTAFGDWFLADELGRCWMLDLLEGRLESVANTREELNGRFGDDTTRDRWFLPGFVLAMQQGGRGRKHGECYAWKIHPILGGKLESNNVVVLGIQVWQAICGQLHEQLQGLPSNARIRRLEHVDDLEIRLVAD